MFLNCVPSVLTPPAAARLSCAPASPSQKLPQSRISCRLPLCPTHWQATNVYARAVAFEKQHGDRAGIEDVIVGERRFQYEDEVRKLHVGFAGNNPPVVRQSTVRC